MKSHHRATRLHLKEVSTFVKLKNLFLNWKKGLQKSSIVKRDDIINIIINVKWTRKKGKLTMHSSLGCTQILSPQMSNGTQQYETFSFYQKSAVNKIMCHQM